MKQPSDFIKNVAEGRDFLFSFLEQIPPLRKKGSVSRFYLRSFIQSWVNAGLNPRVQQYAPDLSEAYFMYEERFYARSLDILNGIPKDIVLGLLPYVYYDCQARLNLLDSAEVIEKIRNLIDAKKVEEAFSYLELLGKARSIDYFYQTLNLFDQLTLPQELRIKLNWYKKFKLEKETGSSKIQSELSVGLIDYNTLDRDISSTNYGDSVQTLALLGNISRFKDLIYQSDDKGLVEFVDFCRERIKEDNKKSSKKVTVNLIPFNRDFSNNCNLPQNTWSFVFGWYMHPNFDQWYDFPLNRNIRPVFISFHLNRKAVLTKQSIDYLKKYQPIGCRDWSTVYLLSSFGISAFFSGCVTSTIGQLFEEKLDVTNHKVADVESKVKIRTNKEIDSFSNVSTEMLEMNFVERLRHAYGILFQYKNYDEIYTSRLHCYLPMRSIGKHVRLTYKGLTDPRLDGLYPVTSEQFSQMQQGIKKKIELVFEKIVSGETPDAIYSFWRDLCSEDVQYANQYIKSNLVERESDDSVLNAAISQLKVNRKIYNPISNDSLKLAFSVDQNLFKYLPVVLESIQQNTRKKLTVVLLLRKVSNEEIEELAHNFPGIQFIVYFCHQISYGENVALLTHISVSTMDRLLLPEIYEAEKVLYLDVDIIVKGDISELYNLDITNYRYAGKKSDHCGWATCDDLISKAARNCTDMISASKLRRTAYGYGPLNFIAANAGVTLMNLDRMRKENFVAKYLPFVQDYKLNDQDVLNLYSMGDRLEIPKEWNVYATQESVNNAKLIHFAGPIKPWGSLYISGKEIFEFYQRLYLSRTNN